MSTLITVVVLSWIKHNRLYLHCKGQNSLNLFLITKASLLNTWPANVDVEEIKLPAQSFDLTNPHSPTPKKEEKTLPR